MSSIGRLGPLLAAMVLAAAAVPAPAQQAAPAYKVGYVNTERVMRNARVSKEMQKGLEAEFAKREKEIAGGPPRDVARRRQALAEEMTQRRDEQLKQIVDRANAIIRRIAEAERYDIVLFEAAWVGPRADLTDRVTKALDAGL